jgi:hypothetical protein
MIIGQKLINDTLQKLSLKKDQIDPDDFMDFIVCNGIHEPDCNKPVEELWDDWQNK